MAVRRNILLFHQAALGDFIVTWPLALALGRIFPQNRLFYVTSGQKGALAEKALRVESVDVESGWHHLFGDASSLPEPAAKLLAGAHSIVTFVASDEDPWSRNVRALAPEATLIPLHTKPPEDFAGHVTKHLLSQLEPWPVVAAACEQILRSVAARGIGFLRGRAGPVVLHPGAGSPAKCWPVDRFVELAEHLTRQGTGVRVLVGEVERERWPAQKIDRLRQVAEVVEPQTLLELLGNISDARAFIGNDSGPGHLAAIIGVPTVTIFGPNDPVRWKPLGPRTRVLRGEWDAITADAVHDAARRVSTLNE